MNTQQKIVFWSILEGTVTFISLWDTANIDRMSEVQFVLSRNKGKHVHISFAHVSETCSFIFNKLGVQKFAVILFLISKSEIRV